MDTTYTPSAKKYYETHKDGILAKEKETKRWISYYQRNKEAIKKKNLERYHAKRGTCPPPPPDPDAEAQKMKRLNEIIAELHQLIPSAIKPPRKRKTNPVAPVELVVSEV